MNRLVCVTVATALLCGLAPADRVSACTCAGGFAFQAYAMQDEIFTGRILTIRRDPTSEYERLIVRVRVAESIKGSATGEVEIISGPLCGFPFEQGRDYLIYATYEADGLASDLCNRTRTLDRAHVDLSYINGVREGRSGANVSGWAIRERTDGQPALREQLQIPMVLSGTGGRFETVLDEGKFEFHFVPPGTYTLSAPGVDLVKIMSSLRDGKVVHEITVDQQTYRPPLAVTFRVKGD